MKPSKSYIICEQLDILSQNQIFLYLQVCLIVVAHNTPGSDLLPDSDGHHMSGTEEQPYLFSSDPARSSVILRG